MDNPTEEHSLEGEKKYKYHSITSILFVAFYEGNGESTGSILGPRYMNVIDNELLRIKNSDSHIT